MQIYPAKIEFNIYIDVLIIHADLDNNTFIMLFYGITYLSLLSNYSLFILVMTY